MDKDAVLQWAQRRMGSAEDDPMEPGYRYYHGLRVGALAVQLAKRMRIGLDPDLLYVGGVLHDLGKSGYRGEDAHGPRGADILRREAAGWFFGAELAQVCRVVEGHYARPNSRWYAGQPKPCWPEEVLVVQDADLLDHFGCNHVWRSVLWAKHLRQSPQEALASYWRNPKEQDWRDEARRALNFEPSREELEVRLRRSDGFCREFAMEQAGTLG